MGGVIPALAGSGNTVYMPIMDMLTADMWDGAALVTYNQSDWADYAISAPEQPGSGRYIMSVPGGLPNGAYWVTPYVQVGGSPAVGVDTPLDILRLVWRDGNIIEVGSALNMGAINGSTAAATKLAVSAGAMVTGAAAAGTLSTTQMTTNLSATVADIYAGRVLYFTSGVNAGLACLITAYAVTGGRLTFVAYGNNPAPSAPSAADTFIVI